MVLVPIKYGSEHSLPPHPLTHSARYSLKHVIRITHGFLSIQFLQAIKSYQQVFPLSLRPLAAKAAKDSISQHRGASLAIIKPSVWGHFFVHSTLKFTCDGLHATFCVNNKKCPNETVGFTCSGALDMHIL